MAIPHSGRALRIFGNVPFYNNCSSGWALGTEEHVGDLNGSFRGCRADLDNNLRLSLICELRTAALDNTPCLADNLTACWDFEGIGDDVCAGIDEDDFATSVLMGKIRSVFKCNGQQ